MVPFAAAGRGRIALGGEWQVTGAGELGTSRLEFRGAGKKRLGRKKDLA